MKSIDSQYSISLIPYFPDISVFPYVVQMGKFLSDIGYFHLFDNASSPLHIKLHQTLFVLKLMNNTGY